jgi:formate hydrogenlyase subunit 6/NADH:ubiquinone oxidoreductase subunit I
MYLINKDDVNRIASELSADYDLYGPVKEKRSGQAFFQRAEEASSIDLEAAIPTNPAKQVIFPQLERILKYRYDSLNKEAVVELEEPSRPKALFGLRSCDLKGILCLDRFFLGQEFVDEFYLAHRNRLFIVTNTCKMPFPQCFCVCTDSGPYAAEGYDLNLTELEDSFLVEVGSDKGKKLVERLGLKEADKEKREIEKRAVIDNSINNFDGAATVNKAWISRVTNRVTTGFITEENWEYIGNQCFECGACTFVCPSCSCFNIEDANVGEGATDRLRTWDSCSYEGYSRMAGDHNPRKPVEDRRNKRFFCKLSYSQSKKYLRPGCVGCGRCAWVCPGDIGLPNVVTYIRREITS